MIDASFGERIATRFGLGDGAVLSAAPMARGEQGQVWLLETDLGKWAVKESFRGISAADVSNAAEFSAAARGAGILTPLAKADIDGNFIADIAGVQIRVHEWFELLKPDVMLDPVAVGRTLATIHCTDFDGTAPLDNWFTEPVGPQRWDALCADLAAAEAPFAGRLAGMREELVALDSWVLPPTNVQTCHRDLWADNLLPTATGGVCVIDWDDCGLADPSYELCCVLREFGCGEPDRIRALYGSYRQHGGPGRVSRHGDFSMLICQLGHICEIACRDWLDPAARSTNRQHSAERFAEFVERPLGRVELDLILDNLGRGPRN